MDTSTDPLEPPSSGDPSGFRAVTISARTLRAVVLLASGAVLLLLIVGVSVALLGLHEVRKDLAELRAAAQAPRAGARPPAPPPPAIPSEPVSLTGAQLKGSRTAKVAILEFSDFQCPFCSRFTQTTYAELSDEYLDTGKVLMAFRHLPLDQLHPNARKAAEAAECAGKQGKFWEMHDKMFMDPSRLGASDLRGHAASIGGLKQPEFERCLAGEFADKVAQDVAEAMRLQVYGTPGFLIGTIQPDGRMKVTDRLSGAQLIGPFKTILDRLLLAGN